METEVGDKFETWVVNLLEDLGCRDAERLTGYIEGKSGAKHQIDVAFKNGILRRRHYGECKYRSNGSKVGKSEISVFIDKLDDIGINPKRGCIFTNSYYTYSAKARAEFVGLGLLDYNDLSEYDLKRLGFLSRVKTKFKQRAPIEEQIKML